LDASLYVIGATSGLYISQVEITFSEITITLATPSQPNLATAQFPVISPPDLVAFVDAYGRPAGVLVSESPRLGFFQSWGTGTHVFLPGESEFAAAVVFPTPEIGVRAIALPTGEVFTGDVWLVGSDGVVLRVQDTTLTNPVTGAPRPVRAIRVDVVGDPLFRRKLCFPESLFETPQFLSALQVVGPNMTFACTPDAVGNILLSANNALAADSVLRLVSTADGLVISTVGSS
jgi:hypothetical protein